MTNEETLTTHSLSVHTKHNTRWLTICGLLMAINVGLSSFGLPVPGGHLYLNDIVIVAAALMLDPLGAFLVGGVGAFWRLLLLPAPDVRLTRHSRSAGHGDLLHRAPRFPGKAEALYGDRCPRRRRHHGRRLFPWPCLCLQYACLCMDQAAV